MKKVKYSEDYLKQVCEEKGLSFIDVETILSGKKYRRCVNFVCSKHIEKGKQTRPIEKIIVSKQPCQYCNHS
ncbi:MAG: hypothetical protein NC401_16040 [Ruminococcus sp.]|nr:hypothetical protein [Ruminococcus sp.]